MPPNRRFRDSRLGRFITPAAATASPDTTVAETISTDPATIASLRWRVQTLEATMLEAAATLPNAYPAAVTVIAATLERVARDRGPEELA